MNNPYRPPSAPVAGADAPAVVTVRGLIRLYQALVVSVTLLGVVFYTGVLQFFATAEMISVSGISGAGALISPGTVEWLYMVVEILLVAAGMGLFFFAWWSRPLYVGTYAASTIIGLMTGAQVSFPVDGLLATVLTLMHGAIMTLSFLPPISGYFARERSAP